MPTLRLAWTEFSLPFRHLRSGVPGGRDFMWLTLMLMLVLTLGLLLQATRIGLLERFVDVFLGSVENHGVPIWVIPNPVSKGSIKFISNEVITDIEKEGFKIYPYREVDAGLDSIELPSPSIWRKQTNLDPDFSGWAVYMDDPLWSEPPDELGSLPLKIVINRSLFRKYFNYREYNNFGKNNLPPSLFSKITEENFNSKTPTDNIWLNIRSGDFSDLQKFKVIWVERIPTIKNIAFLFPMPTYHALHEAINYPELRYFPEFQGRAGPRLKRIAITGDVDNSKFNKFLKISRGKVFKLRGRTIVEFRHAQQTDLVDKFLLNAGLTYRALDSVQGHSVIDHKTHLQLPCDVLPKLEFQKLSSKEKGNKNCVAMKDVTSAGNGFLRAFIYVPDRTTLNIAVDRSLKIHNQALSIHPIYKDALNRFGFLTKIVDALRLPYGIVLFLFLISVLGIQIGTLVDHRRSRYGIFLAKGVNWYEIFQILYF